MGYEVKNYDLGEIIQLKERGNIIPSLFWAIPIGKWPAGDLHTLWYKFTEEPNRSVCAEVGLLLVKNISKTSGRNPIIIRMLI